MKNWRLELRIAYSKKEQMPDNLLSKAIKNRKDPEADIWLAKPEYHQEQGKLHPWVDNYMNLHPKFDPSLN